MSITRRAVLGAIAALALIVGSLGPRIDLGFFKVHGAGLLSYVAMAAGVGALVLVVLDRWPGLLGVLGTIAAACTVYVLVIVGKAGDGAGQFAIGWGALVAVAASIVLVGIGLDPAWRRERRVGGAATALALAAIVGSGAIAATRADPEPTTLQAGDEPADAQPYETMEPIPTIPPLPTDEPTPSASSRAQAGPSVAPLAKSCGGTTVSEATSCGFADNVWMAYLGDAGENGGPRSTTVDVQSDATGETYSMRCVLTGPSVTCRGGTGAAVRFSADDLPLG